MCLSHACILVFVLILKMEICFSCRLRTYDIRGFLARLGEILDVVYLSICVNCSKEVKWAGCNFRLVGVLAIARSCTPYLSVDVVLGNAQSVYLCES